MQANVNGNSAFTAAEQAAATRALFSMLWQDYTARVPDALRIEAALRARGQRWTEDHVAFRTLPGTPCDAATLGSFFASLGYTRRDSYRFRDKRLDAFWMAPPVTSDTLAWDAPPKIFISELDVAAFPPAQREILEAALDAVKPHLRPAPVPLNAFVGRPEAFIEAARRALTFEPRKTGLELAAYNAIRTFSEYGAWTLVFGACVNHFTVSVHLMDNFERLSDLNAYLKNSLGVALNVTGDAEIKGSPDVDLEQSATLAAPSDVRFADGQSRIPYAFVEFAYRFRVPRDAHPRFWNSYFQGFVEANADRIFSSTDLRTDAR